MLWDSITYPCQRCPWDTITHPSLWYLFLAPNPQIYDVLSAFSILTRLWPRHSHYETKTLRWIQSTVSVRERLSWWRHQMETFSMLLTLCARNSLVTGEFPHKGQWRGALMFSLICAWVILSKQSWGWWFETPSRSSWRHCNLRGHGEASLLLLSSFSDYGLYVMHVYVRSPYLIYMFLLYNHF